MYNICKQTHMYIYIYISYTYLYNIATKFYSIKYNIYKTTGDNKYKVN